MRNPARPYTTTFEFELDIAKIAAAMFVPEEVVLEILGDGRASSRWSEYWGAIVGNLSRAKSASQECWDLSTEVSSVRIEISSKTLSRNGVKFQESKFTGTGRVCTKQNLLDSLEAVDLLQVVDITQLPVIQITTIHSRHLRKEVREGRLSYSGWAAMTFAAFVNRVYDRDVLRVDPEMLLSPVDGRLRLVA